MDTVCFGGEDWWYHNRGHIDMQLMRRFAKCGPTLYINSLIMQKPSFKKSVAGGRSFSEKLIRKSKSIFQGLKKSDQGFWVYSPFSMPVHHIVGMRSLNAIILQAQLWLVLQKLRIHAPIVWVACPVACDVALKMKKTNLVYQRTDRFEEYPNVDSAVIRQYDQELKRSADLTVYVNNSLFEEEKSQCRKAIYLDHGVDYEFFIRGANGNEPTYDIQNIQQPIIGFFGGIDNHTLDVPFLEAVVRRLREMSFVLIGKASADLSRLQKDRNVKVLGQKPYEQIPSYGSFFDVCIMPWRQNRWIQACNPIKLKEYLALGKPVVSTPFPELQKYADVVYQAATPEEFAQKIRQALAEDSEDLINARRRKVEQSTWESKAELVLSELFGE